MMHTCAGTGYNFRGRLSKAHSGLIYDNRIFKHERPQASVVSERESRFGMAVGEKTKK
jgi:hypothetical protein